MILKPLAVLVSSALIASATLCSSQAPAHYQPTLESLDRHPLPQWYAGAKLGIFIHWGLYSVPGWAPLIASRPRLSSQDYIKYNPYAEWYLNVMRISGSPTQAYQREHYGANSTTTTSPPRSTANRRSGIPTRWPRSSASGRALRGAHQQASRGIYAVAEHHTESKS